MYVTKHNQVMYIPRWETEFMKKFNKKNLCGFSCIFCFNILNCEVGLSKHKRKAKNWERSMAILDRNSYHQKKFLPEKLTAIYVDLRLTDKYILNSGSILLRQVITDANRWPANFALSRNKANLAAILKEQHRIWRVLL